ncbi:MAG: serine/threonine protein phosphatase [Thaumarchaeota archaeon]|nr:serine/threonine protein phosphatase [Nitrososphaerota archaeon]
MDDAKSVLERERSTRKIRGGKINSGLLELQAPKNLAIIGDIHGDSHTLLKILNLIDHANYLSNPDNKLVFLGDYVDRGSDSIGVLYTILRLKADYHDSVVLMRGNHEAPVQFPFPSHTLAPELKKKFPYLHTSLYEKILSIFELLTLVTIVQDSLVMVHGGLPITFMDANPKMELAEAVGKRRVLEEILWNDPRDAIENNQDWEKSRRNFGYHFGENISKRWLSIFGARVIVRGHEPCLGIMISHSDRVVTLFSSKQAYPDFEAGFIRVSDQELRNIKWANDLSEYYVSAV